MDKSGWTALHYCAENGSVSTLQFLVAEGLDPYILTTRKGTILHVACANGVHSMVKHILREYPDLRNKTDINKWSALHLCAERGDVELFKLLISHDVRVYESTKDWATVLHIACWNGRTNMVKYILKKYPDLLHLNYNIRWSPLHASAESGNLEICKLLIRVGMDIHSLNVFGMSVLHCASLNNRHDLVKYLLKAYAKLKNQVNEMNWTALHFSAAGGNVELFDFLVAQGLNVFALTTDVSTVLHLASSNRRYELVRYLMKNFPRLIERKNSQGFTALHASAEGGDIHIFKFLVDHGSSVLTVTTQGVSVLHMACGHGNIGIVKYLISTFPDLKGKKDFCKLTPLHYCALGGHLDIFEYLVSTYKGTEYVFSLTKDGESVLHMACRNNRYKMAESILTVYPDLKHKVDNYEWTALHRTAECGNVQLFKLLVSHGLDVYDVIPGDVTVLHIACLNSRLDLVKYCVREYPDLTNKVTSIGWTALHFSAAGDSLQTLHFLTDNGLDLYSVTSEMETVLHVACRNGSDQIVSCIIAQFPDMLRKTDKRRWSALHSSAAGGFLHIFKLLENYGLNALEETEHEETCLDLANLYGGHSVAQYLVEKYLMVQTPNTTDGGKGNSKLQAGDGTDFTTPAGDVFENIDVEAYCDSVPMDSEMIEVSPAGSSCTLNADDATSLMPGISSCTLNLDSVSMDSTSLMPGVSSCTLYYDSISMDSTSTTLSDLENTKRKLMVEKQEMQRKQRKRELRQDISRLRKDINQLQLPEGAHSTGLFKAAHDASDTIANHKVLVECADRVGVICYTGGRGTGFRCGPNFVFTAAHIVNDILRSTPLTGGASRVTALADNSVYIDFAFHGKLHSSTDQSCFRFKPIIRYQCSTLDVAVLELEDSPHIPPPFRNFADVPALCCIRFIGHDQGDVKKTDKVSQIHTLAPGECQKAAQWSISCIGYDGYLGIDDPDRVLFHCTFAQGASGSPGVVIKQDGTASVVTMLLKGYPSWFYDRSVSSNLKAGISPEDLIEQGVRISSVEADMKYKDPVLHSNIFF